MIVDGDIDPYSNNNNDLGHQLIVGETYTPMTFTYLTKVHLMMSMVAWGDWTIQEGESDLFLKNNRSGKKYKFNLTEVS